MDSSARRVARRHAQIKRVVRRFAVVRLTRKRSPKTRDMIRHLGFPTSSSRSTGIQMLEPNARSDTQAAVLTFWVKRPNAVGFYVDEDKRYESQLAMLKRDHKKIAAKAAELYAPLGVTLDPAKTRIDVNAYGDGMITEVNLIIPQVEAE